MNYTALRTSVQNNGRFDTSQDTVIKDWMTTAYAQIWSAADWQFKKVQDATLSVVSGTDTPTMPTDFGEAPEIWDQYGCPMRYMTPADFNDRYRYDKINSRTGQPEAFKLVNRVVTLGPTPNATANFTLNYERRTCAFAANGTTVVVGGMSADTDIPFWDSQHHMVIVYKTLEIGGGLESDNSAVMWSELGKDALDAMERELATVEMSIRQWGRI